MKLAGTAEVRSHDYASDAVIAQDPAPGTHGATVALLVNRGVRGVSYVMPDLIGVDGDRAAELLRDTRLPRRGCRHTAVPWRPLGHRASDRRRPVASRSARAEAIALEVSR